jgi:hypothetical protein
VLELHASGAAGEDLDAEQARGGQVRGEQIGGGAHRDLPASAIGFALAHKLR